ncbi:NAD-dependent epimerase/dehydratase family protein [Streptomyces sp. NPDC050625]|uniref:NAD-dependent epimerase/dehydratase family protein n=1 Tax=Streptomyces sp. NPDC050625 TaxID=3154629 RepID=UPI003439B701
MRILIAGGTGVLGRRILPELLNRGHEVTVLARTPQRAASLAERGATVVQGDVFDRAALCSAVSHAAPEVVMHQLTDLTHRCSQANARIRKAGTRNLVDAAAAAGVNQFIAQSIAWCYEAGDEPADESVPLDAHAEDPTRRAVVDAVATLECYAAEFPRHVILRNGALYGPDTWYAANGDHAAAAQSGTISAEADVTSFVHAVDAAAAAVAALDWPTGPVNVVDTDPAPGTEWVPAFCEAIGAPAPQTSGAPRRGWARGADNSRARALGWSPTFASWRDGFFQG